jgi:hypothetical protein
LVVAGCAAPGVPDEVACAPSDSHFAQTWPALAEAFGMAGRPPGRAPAAIVAGAAQVAARRLPPDDRVRCYQRIMRGAGFTSFPPYQHRA